MSEATKLNEDSKKDFERPAPSHKLSTRFILEYSPPENETSNKDLESTSASAHQEADEILLQQELPGLIHETPVLEPSFTVELPPEKMYFRIGEVSELLGVEGYVLRYWEGEFSSFVKPSKTRTGQRVYARKDVEMLALIRYLLHVEKYSIKGAKNKLAQRRKVQIHEKELSKKSREVLRQMASELKEIIRLVQKM